MRALKLLVYRKPSVSMRFRNAGWVRTEFRAKRYEAKFYERRTGLRPRRWIQEFMGLLHTMYDHSTATDWRWNQAEIRMYKRTRPHFGFATENF